jgi:large subunit ribosomal protein L13
MAEQKTEHKQHEIVVDATNAVLGRLASFAAKQALLHKKVVIVNCAEAIVTGGRRMVIHEYKDIREKGGASLRGPFFPKNPERILKRTIRGMLSYKQGRGADALGRIMCYNHVPMQYQNAKKILAGKEKKTITTKLSELSKEI